MLLLIMFDIHCYIATLHCPRNSKPEISFTYICNAYIDNELIRVPNNYLKTVK